MKSRCGTTEQSVGILKEAKSGHTPKELCLKCDINGATMYHWKSKYGGLTVGDSRQVRLKPGTSG